MPKSEFIEAATFDGLFGSPPRRPRGPRRGIHFGKMVPGRGAEGPPSVVNKRRAPSLFVFDDHAFRVFAFLAFEGAQIESQLMRLDVQ